MSNDNPFPAECLSIELEQCNWDMQHDLDDFH